MLKNTMYSFSIYYEIIINNALRCVAFTQHLIIPLTFSHKRHFQVWPPSHPATKEFELWLVEVKEVAVHRLSPETRRARKQREISPVDASRSADAVGLSRSQTNRCVSLKQTSAGDIDSKPRLDNHARMLWNGLRAAGFLRLKARQH